MILSSASCWSSLVSVATCFGVRRSCLLVIFLVFLMNMTCGIGVGRSDSSIWAAERFIVLPGYMLG